MSGELRAKPLTDLKGVGPKLVEKLSELGIFNQQDLLFHLPLRFEDRSTIHPIGGLQAGSRVLVQGEIRLADVTFGRRRSLAVKIQDKTGLLTLRFYHFSKAQKQAFTAGQHIQCFGDVRRGKAGLEMYHPEYKITATPINQTAEHGLSPIYPTTKSLQQRTWRNLLKQVLTSLKSQPPKDFLPNEDISLGDALKSLHEPAAGQNVVDINSGDQPAIIRLAKEELAAQYIAHRQIRAEFKAQKAPLITGDIKLREQFLEQLPFKPTSAQTRVSQEIATDIASAKPMLRLVQGDVGSGKTLVAALAALNAISQGYQVVLMAPTEILAEQHFLNFDTWFSPLNIQLEFLSSSIKGQKRKQALTLIESGEAQLVIGTHALFQNDVNFAKLGLVVIDEQHRFGVHQRLQLKQKGRGITPHQLIMTATPIPRTLTMTQFAELDCSVIDELPPNRKPVTTTLLEANKRQKLTERVRIACEQGHQAYWVCTLVEESEVLEAEAAEKTAELLEAQLPSLTVGLIHGRLKRAEKAAIMAAFKQGDIDLLVATTVIEVGVDVPNANLMVIENPERLGLAQLHQLRGRVGRGSAASHCVLLYQKPLSQNGRQRLEAMRDSNDGFYIAEKDLEIRGPGEILGTRQTGELNFKIADIQRDAHLLDEAQTIGEQLLQQLNPEDLQLLTNRWLSGKAQYADV